jgi:hypothetical protein
MNMELIGHIEPGPGGRLEKSSWVALIERHPQLARVPSREGINPFTKKPVKFEAPPTSARVLSSDIEIGNITWAEDGSDLLNVWTASEPQTQLAELARQIAESLKCRFVAKT